MLYAVHKWSLDAVAGVVTLTITLILGTNGRHYILRFPTVCPRSHSRPSRHYHPALRYIEHKIAITGVSIALHTARKSFLVTVAGVFTSLHHTLLFGTVGGGHHILIFYGSSSPSSRSRAARRHYTALPYVTWCTKRPQQGFPSHCVKR